MNHFDTVARAWDQNPERFERSEAIANEMIHSVLFNHEMRALEYGAGTGILSFVLKDYFTEIVMMDNSSEMVQVMKEKVEAAKLSHLKPVCFDLEESIYHGDRFDVIYNLLVMHHVQNIDLVLEQFAKMLNPNGSVVLIDLFAEDGSFHDQNFNGHNGFDPEYLAGKLATFGFSPVSYQQCHTIIRENEAGVKREFPLFMMIGKR